MPERRSASGSMTASVPGCAGTRIGAAPARCRGSGPSCIISTRPALRPFRTWHPSRLRTRRRGLSRNGSGIRSPSLVDAVLAATARRLASPPRYIAPEKVEPLAADAVRNFLDHLEADRGNRASACNVRLSAIKSFVRYLEYRLPSCLDLARQFHAIPMKRHGQAVVRYPDREEIRVLLDAPDAKTPAGLRNRAKLHLSYTAGLRVPEPAGATMRDLAQPGLDGVPVMGKGRRERVPEAAGDIRMASLWLGHAGIQSAEVYLRADPVGKLDVLAGNRPPTIAGGGFRDAPDRLPAIPKDVRATRQC